MVKEIEVKQKIDEVALDEFLKDYANPKIKRKIEDSLIPDWMNKAAVREYPLFTKLSNFVESEMLPFKALSFYLQNRNTPITQENVYSPLLKECYGEVKIGNVELTKYFKELIPKEIRKTLTKAEKEVIKENLKDLKLQKMVFVYREGNDYKWKIGYFVIFDNYPGYKDTLIRVINKNLVVSETVKTILITVIENAIEKDYFTGMRYPSSFRFPILFQARLNGVFSKSLESVIPLRMIGSYFSSIFDNVELDMEEFYNKFLKMVNEMLSWEDVKPLDVLVAENHQGKIILKVSERKILEVKEKLQHNKYAKKYLIELESIYSKMQSDEFKEYFVKKEEPIYGEKMIPESSLENTNMLKVYYHTILLAREFKKFIPTMQKEFVAQYPQYSF